MTVKTPFVIASGARQSRFFGLLQEPLVTVHFNAKKAFYTGICSKQAHFLAASGPNKKK
jgi:hypothetical protein